MDNKINDALTDERAASISVSPTTLTFTNSASSKAVTVTCSDSSWTVGGSNNWCTITKSSNTRATVKVTANSGEIRKVGVVCTSGSNVAQIMVTQAANINVKSMINIYKQEGLTCGATCACMCVKQSPETVSAAGFDLSYADWSGIAEEYGYTISAGPSSNPTFTTVYKNPLAKGLPAIVKINDGSDGEYEHWVVLVCCTGSDRNDSSSYICADPWTGNYVQLDKATNYNCQNNKFYRYLVYKKN